MVLGGGTFSREGEQRVFAYAVLASIVLHGVLLFAGFHFRNPARKSLPAPGPIIARLMEVRPAPAPVPAPAEPAPKPRAEEPPPPPKVAAPAPVPVPHAKAAPKAPTVPATPRPAVPVSEAPKPAVESPVPAAPAAPPAPSTPPAPPAAVAKVEPQPVPAAPAAAEAGTLDQYRILIYGAAKKYKKYPRVALDNNWEGKVVITMVIGANTMISSMSVKTTSGHEILDQAALETLRKAKPLVPIPAALRGKEFSVDINFIFNLKDGNA